MWKPLRFATIVLLVELCAAAILQAATRRDITTLSHDELRAYRDGFRELQAHGEYARLAGYHGCPDYYCHDEVPYRRFLPWHRAYVLEFEKALQHIDHSLALHYWDWTSSDAEQHGIPAAFTDTEYESGGHTYPNPLLRFRYNCEGDNQLTDRSPIDPSILAQFRDEVTSALTRTTYDSFNASSGSPVGIQLPHGNLHGWVGGDMGSTTFAAYDPIFWAHHSNVDRQWAAWQDSPNGAEPNDTIKDLTLTPFDKTVRDMLDYRALGYDYDRLTTHGEVFRLAATKNRAMLKNFATPREGEPVWVTLKDVPEHPEKAYRLFFFVDQPDATAKDATADNPNFAGFHHVFGGRHGGTTHAHAERQRSNTNSTPVLDIAPTLQRLAANKSSRTRGDWTITVVAVDPKNRAVEASALPFKEFTVERGETGSHEKHGQDEPSRRNREEDRK